jgi:hypothetical protein
VIVLMIGVNNAPLITANGAPVATAAHGIKLCVENLRLRCPQSQIVLNRLLDTLKLESDPKVHVLDLWSEFIYTDSLLKTELYSDKHLHLSPPGYEVFARKLKLRLKQYLPALSAPKLSNAQVDEP